MKAGEACFFDTGVLHETEENITDSERVAVFLNLIPSCSTPKLYQWNPSRPHELELYEVTIETINNLKPNFYMDNIREFGARLIGSFEYRFDTLDDVGMKEILGK